MPCSGAAKGAAYKISPSHTIPTIPPFMGIDFWQFSSDWGLAGLAASSFLSSTILPGTSEAAAAAFAAAFPERTLEAFLIASAFNTAGAMTTWWLGRFIPGERKVPPKALAALRKWGTAALLFSWAPVVGDALSLGAGILKLPFLPSLFFTLAGKSLRYAVVLGFVSLL